jgi:hypothetical protein
MSRDKSHTPPEEKSGIVLIWGRISSFVSPPGEMAVSIAELNFFLNDPEITKFTLDLTGCYTGCEPFKRAENSFLLI